MTEPKPERFISFPTHRDPVFYVKDKEPRSLDIPAYGDRPDTTRRVYQMDVLDASGKRAILQVSPAIMARIARESRHARRLAEMPWYTRWPSLAFERIRYWSGRAIGAVLKKVRRK